MEPGALAGREPAWEHARRTEPEPRTHTGPETLQSPQVQLLLCSTPSLDLLLHEPVGPLTSSFSQCVLALSAPWTVLANVRCFLISSHLNKNEKHQEHNVNYFCQKKAKQLHHISKPTEISFPILTIFINPLIK